MPMRLSAVAATLLVGACALAACSPRTEPPAPIESSSVVLPGADDNHFPAGDITPFLGRWRQSAAVIAPWWDGKGETPEANPEFASRDMILTATTATGPAIVACEEAVYEVKTMPVEALFAGALPDPWTQAKELGIGGAYAPTLIQSCKSSTGGLELQFPMIDNETLLLGLDAIIYTLTRVAE